MGININNIQIDQISENDFSQLNKAQKLFDEPGANRCFLIKGENIELGYKWFEGIDPKTLLVKEYEIFLIASFNKVYGVSVTSGNINFALGVSDRIVGLEIVSLGFLIISETSVIRINATDCSISNSISVPNIILDYEIDDETIFIQSVVSENESYKL